MDPKDFPEDGSCFEHTRELYDFICKIRPNIKPGGYQSIKIKPGMAWSKYGIWFVTENSGKPRYTIKELEEYYKPQVLSYKGDIAGFPFEVVDKMLHYQKQQGNKMNIAVFEECRFKNDLDGGFSWDKTTEGYHFWQEVIGTKYFNRFFEVYPKEEDKTEPGYPTLADCREKFPQGTTFNNSNVLNQTVNDYTIDDIPAYIYDNTSKTFIVKWSNKAFTIWKNGVWANIITQPLSKHGLLDTAEKMFPEGTVFNNSNVVGSKQPDHTIGKGTVFTSGTATGDIYADAFSGTFTIYSKSKNMWADIVKTKTFTAEYPMTPEESYPPHYHAGLDPYKDCVGDVVIHTSTAGPITLHFGTGHPDKLEDDPVIMHKPSKSIKPLINFNK